MNKRISVKTLENIKKDLENNKVSIFDFVWLFNDGDIDESSKYTYNHNNVKEEDIISGKIECITILEAFTHAERIDLISEDL